MSHKSVGVGRIRNLELLKRIAEEKGVQVSGPGSFVGHYIGKLEGELILSYRDGKAALVKDKDKDEYRIEMDNWNNPLTQVIGQTGATLCRDYMVEVAKEEAFAMGGVVAEEEINRDGSVDILIQIAV